MNKRKLLSTRFLLGAILAIAIGLFLVLGVQAAFASFDVSLKYGSKGEAVVELQDFLQDQGLYNGKLDGKFGFGTLRAVKAFQDKEALKSDGYFGKASRARANSILDVLLKSSNETELQETGTVAPIISPVSVPQTIYSAPIVEVVTPKEIDLYSMLDGKDINSNITSKVANFSYVHLHEGDKVSFTFNGNTQTKTIESTNGNAQFLFTGLTPNTSYSYTLKIERDNTFSIVNGQFTTINE